MKDPCVFNDLLMSGLLQKGDFMQQNAHTHALAGVYFRVSMLILCNLL